MARDSTFSIEIHSQVLEDVHVRRMSDGRHGGGTAFAVYVRDGLCADIQNQRVHKRHVVPCARLIGHLENR